MTNYDVTAGTEDPQSLLDELRRSIEFEDRAATLPDEPTDSEAWGEQHLRHIEFTPPAVVLAAADVIIPPRQLGPEARSKMIKAASRALAERRKMNGLLPILLKSVREQRQMTIVDVAKYSKLSEEIICALENGDTEVNSLAVDVTVAWIRAVPVDRAKVLAALRLSLQTGRTDDRILAAGLSNGPASVDDYIDRVAAMLDTTDKEQEL